MGEAKVALGLLRRYRLEIVRFPVEFTRRCFLADPKMVIPITRYLFCFDFRSFRGQREREGVAIVVK